MDEGRALFVYLHKLDWFVKRMSESDRALSKTYPHMCVLSGKMKINPLNDTTSDPSRSVMLVILLVTSWFLIRLKNESGFENFKDLLKNKE